MIGDIIERALPELIGEQVLLEIHNSKQIFTGKLLRGGVNKNNDEFRLDMRDNFSVNFKECHIKHIERLENV